MQLPTAVQVTAFVPPPLGPAVDTVRRRWDPLFGTLIDAHITLVHRLADDLTPDDVAARVRELPPIRARVTEVRRWAGVEVGLYLEVLDVAGEIAALRDALEAVQPPGLEYIPHVTLLHPSTATPAKADAAWDELSEWRPNCDIVIDQVDVIDVHESGWRPLRTIGLGGPNRGV